jgi:hypothetical protein
MFMPKFALCHAIRVAGEKARERKIIRMTGFLDFVHPPVF